MPLIHKLLLILGARVRMLASSGTTRTPYKHSLGGVLGDFSILYKSGFEG